MPSWFFMTKKKTQNVRSFVQFLIIFHSCWLKKICKTESEEEFHIKIKIEQFSPINQSLLLWFSFWKLEVRKPHEEGNQNWIKYGKYIVEKCNSVQKGEKLPPLLLNCGFEGEKSTSLKFVHTKGQHSTDLERKSDRGSN